MESKKENPLKGKEAIIEEREYARKWGFLDGYLNYQLDALETERKKLIDQGKASTGIECICIGLKLAPIAMEVIDEMWDKSEKEIYAEIERRLRKGDEKGEA